MAVFSLHRTPFGRAPKPVLRQEIADSVVWLNTYSQKEKNFAKKCKIYLTKCKVYFTFTNIKKYPKCKKGEKL